MDYKKIYEELITKAQNRTQMSGYVEKHHIIPRSVGGTDEKSNIVDLSLREHYVAHKLLVYIYPNSSSLACALWLMTSTTVGALAKSEAGRSYKRQHRIHHYIEDGNNKFRITSREYEDARRGYIETKKKKVYSVEERKNVSIGTKKGMQNRRSIEKAISGSKGCHFYHSKIDGSVHKWFPGDPDIDTRIYEWGRYKMTAEQKKKISDSNNLNRRYFIIPSTNSKYTLYTDFVSEPPKEWEEKWTNESNRELRKMVIAAVREFNIQTDFQYDHTIVFQVPNKSKSFKIITPSLYIACGDTLKKWRQQDVTMDLVNSLKKNIDKIIELNNIYIKDKLKQ